MDTLWEFFGLIVAFFLLTSYLLVMFLIVVDLFRDRDTSGLAKAGWVLFLIVLPVLTALIYLVMRGEKMSGRSEARYDRAPSPTDEITRAKGLLDAGVIQPDEYDKIKARALA